MHNDLLTLRGTVPVFAGDGRYCDCLLVNLRPDLHLDTAPEPLFAPPAMGRPRSMASPEG